VLYYAAVLLLHNNCGRYPAALAAARSAANYDLVPVCTRNVGVISAAQPVTRPWDRHDERWFATDLAPAGGQHVSGVAPRALRHEARGGGVAVKEGLLRTGVAGPICVRLVCSGITISGYGRLACPPSFSAVIGHSIPTSYSTCGAIPRARRRRLGPVQIAGRPGVPASTVHELLTRCRINRPSDIDRVTGEPPRRYAHGYPGTPDHVDVTKFGNVPDGGSHKFLSRQQSKRNTRDRRRL
jgi:hypothetical protein